MRATLLTAQKMASQMVKDAEAEKAKLLDNAEADAAARKAELEAEIATVSERLRLAKEESAAFIANMRRLCNSELEFLDGVPAIQIDIAPKAAPAATVEEQVESIESSVMASFEDSKNPFDEEAPAQETLDNAVDAILAEEAAPAAEASVEAPVEEKEDLDATRRIDFGDLKFGRNYKSNT